MNNQLLTEKLALVQHRADLNKRGRCILNPFKYISVAIFRIIVYPIFKKNYYVNTNLFFNKKMFIALPSAIDIYLTGGKTHPSEIRLAQYLIKTLRKNDVFFDIGAHFGYFTLLVSEILEQTGNIISCEPSRNSFKILQKNVEDLANIIILNNLISDKDEQHTFYEFNNHFSEYSSIDIAQYQDQSWFQQNKPNKILIESYTIDALIVRHNMIPTIIKVDVEGAEYRVIKGAMNLLNNHAPIIILEFIANSRSNENHLKAASLLHSWQYKSYSINTDGSLQLQIDLEAYLNLQKLDSDNIVFIKN